MLPLPTDIHIQYQNHDTNMSSSHVTSQNHDTNMSSENKNCPSLSSVFYDKVRHFFSRPQAYIYDGAYKESVKAEQYINRGAVRTERIIYWFFMIMMGIVFVAICIYGMQSEWFANSGVLKNPNNLTKAYGILFAWVICLIFGMLGLFFLWRFRPLNSAHQLYFMGYFVFGSVLLVIWALIMFYWRNITAATCLLFFMFAYNLFLIMYLGYSYPLASLFLVPLLFAQGFLYSYLVTRLYK